MSVFKRARQYAEVGHQVDEEHRAQMKFAVALADEMTTEYFPGEPLLASVVLRKAAEILHDREREASSNVVKLRRGRNESSQRGQVSMTRLP